MEDRFSERLKKEVAAWQQERLISEGQAGALLARYGLVEGELEERRSKMVCALAFLGALLLGVGVITFFAANWPSIPGWFKLLLIFAAVIAAYTAGYWMRFERQWSPRIGNALIFLGTLLFGAALFLIAQGFHIRTNEPTLLYLWAVGILPMAYLLTAPAMVIVAIAAFAIGIGWDVAGLGPELGSAPFSVLSLYLVFGVLLYSLGELHRQGERSVKLHSAYTVSGLFISLGVLYVWSFRDSWVGSWDGGTREPTLFSPFGWRFVALMIPAAIFTVAHGARTRGARRVPEIVESVAICLLLYIAWIVAFADRGFTSPYDVFYPPAAIVFNLLLFALTIGVIADGYLERHPTLVNAGIFSFAVHLFTRYFDIFGRLLHTSLVFIGAGLILLLGGAYLERTRRALVRQLTADPS